MTRTLQLTVGQVELPLVLGVATAMRLRMSEAVMPLTLGFPETPGIIERLTAYTVADLDAYTVAQLDDLLSRAESPGIIKWLTAYMVGDLNAYTVAELDTLLGGA